MPSLGPLEIVVIAVVALLVFGPNRLPEVGRQVGRAMRELRKFQEEMTRSLQSELEGEKLEQALAEYKPDLARSLVSLGRVKRTLGQLLPASELIASCVVTTSTSAGAWASASRIAPSSRAGSVTRSACRPNARAHAA